MDTISAGNDFLVVIARMGWEARNAALLMAALIVPLVAVYGVLKFYFGQEGSGGINLNKYLFYNIFMLMVLNFYPYIVDTTGSFTNILVNTFDEVNTVEMFDKISKSKEALYGFQKMGRLSDIADEIAKADEAHEQGKIGWIEKQWMLAKSAVKGAWYGSPVTTPYGTAISGQDLLNSLDSGSAMLEVGFVKSVRIIVEMIRNVILGFLIIVGPFAILFDFIPAWRGQFQHWFKIFVAVLVWALVFNILDNLFVAYNEQRAANAAFAFIDSAKDINKSFQEMYDANGGEGGFINFIFALMYIFVPYLTTLFAGGEVATQLFGVMMTQMNAMAAKAIGSMGMPSMGSGGKGGSPVPSIGKITDNS